MEPSSQSRLTAEWWRPHLPGLSEEVREGRPAVGDSLKKMREEVLEVSMPKVPCRLDITEKGEISPLVFQNFTHLGT